MVLFGLMTGALLALMGSVCFTLYVNSNVTYREKLITRQEAYDEAKTYYDSDVCQSERLRQQLGEYNKCLRYKKTIDSKPDDLAMNDWLEAYTLCKPGQCLVTSFSMSQLITQVIPAIAFFVIFVLSIVGYFVWDCCIRRDDREMEIPFTAIASHIASQAQSMLANMQAQTNNEKSKKSE
jgi:hypothetical protein